MDRHLDAGGEHIVQALQDVVFTDSGGPLVAVAARRPTPRATRERD